MLVNAAKKLYRNMSKASPLRIISLGFVLVILTGTMLLSLPIASRSGMWTSFLNALFTATASTCVTGLLIADIFTNWTIFGQLVILVLIQIGGLGFMTVATLFSFIIRRHITLRERMIITEAYNFDTFAGIVRLSKHVIIGTVIIEFLGAVLLSCVFVPQFGWLGGIYKGIFHSVSAFCNAGIDLMGQIAPFSGLTSYVGNPLVNITIMGLIIIGGIGFVVWEDIYCAIRHRKYSYISTHSKIVLTTTLVLIFGGAVLFYLFETANPETMANLPLSSKIWASLFASVAPRSAGFHTIPIASMTNDGKFLSIILMFIGGSPGSTAGGIKTSTLTVIIFSVISIFRGNSSININKKRLSQTIILRAFIVLFVGLAVVTGGNIVLNIFENDKLFIDILMEVVAAFGTVGLSTGITPYLHNVSKITLILLMYFGRVGVLTLGLSLMMKGAGRSPKIKYPEAKVFIG